MAPKTQRVADGTRMGCSSAGVSLRVAFLRLLVFLGVFRFLSPCSPCVSSLCLLRVCLVSVPCVCVSPCPFHAPLRLWRVSFVSRLGFLRVPCVSPLCFPLCPLCLLGVASSVSLLSPVCPLCALWESSASSFELSSLRLVCAGKTNHANYSLEQCASVGLKTLRQKEDLIRMM